MLSLVSRLTYKLKAWEFLPILVMRVVLGVFFAHTGYLKVFTEKGQQQMLHIVTQSGIPFPEINAMAASVSEMVGGGLLVVGLFTMPASLILAGVMGVAFVTNYLPDMPTGSILSAIKFLAYNIEFLYVLIFTWLMFEGPGKISLDSWLRK